MEPLGSAGPLAITVIGMSGDVLLGPGAKVDPGESVRGLKRRLPDCGGAWRLLENGRELLDGECLASVCRADAVSEISAIATKTTATELAQLMETSRADKVQLQEDNAQWLREFAEADEERKLEQRDRDVRAFRRAVAALVQQLCEDAVQRCRRCAREGKGSTQFHIDDLQQYELGRMFFFCFSRAIRADPLLRGWYFTSHGFDIHDPAEVPETLRMGNPRPGEAGVSQNMIFVHSIAGDLVTSLEEQGLRVAPGSYFGVLQISWSEEPMEEYAKWW